ncbi:MAG: carboxylesterase family protein [Burkholderiaceae bacterium]
MSRDDRLTVATCSGAVQGVMAASAAAGPGVRVWRGIPYAAAPVGPLRWRAPQPAGAWPGVRLAHEFGADFPQAPLPVSRAPTQSEDCLMLNIWVPAAPASSRLPVMVWLHGGGFTGGSGADARCEGMGLAQHGVIVVTFNYRSGLFGFLAHPGLNRESEHGVSGNYGLLDQLAALRWVRDNIEGFGGDPQRVTVFGVSAGSASIALLLTSPHAHGLFHRAIAHSPGTARPLASLQDAELAGATLGDDIDALRRLSATDILALTPRLAPKVRGLTTPRVLRPIRDGWVIPEDERPVFKQGRLHAMPLIVGTNRDEGSLLTAAWPMRTLAEHRQLIAANFAGATQQALARYPAASDADVRASVAAMFGDTQFNYGARLLAQAMSRVEPRTWRYLFTRRRPGQMDGPHHGDEVAHVFGNLAVGRGSEAAAFDARDEELSAALRRAWVAFAMHGDPNAPGSASWSRFTQAGDGHLEFGDAIQSGSAWRCEQLDFLDRFYGDA